MSKEMVSVNLQNVPEGSVDWHAAFWSGGKKICGVSIVTTGDRQEAFKLVNEKFRQTTVKCGVCQRLRQVDCWCIYCDGDES